VTALADVPTLPDAGDQRWAATPVGLVVFAVSVSLHQRDRKRRRLRAHELNDMFPADP
jgi:hypothetical protein